MVLYLIHLTTPNNPANVDTNNDGNPDDATVTTFPVEGSIGITKATIAATDGIYDTVGEMIRYTIVVTNTGSTTLTAINITDVNADAGSISPATIATLTPGSSVTVFATHTITQADLDTGSVNNTANVSATDPYNNTVTDMSDDPNNNTDNDLNGDGEPDDVTETIVNQKSEIQLTKATVPATDGTYDIEGEVINYTIIVTNTGNVTLTNVVVTDINADAGSIIPATIATLAPGTGVNVMASHTITQTELDNGSVTNTATVNGSAPNGSIVTDTSDDPNNSNNNDTNGDGEPDDPTVTSIVRRPSISLTKATVPAADGVYDTAGEIISYTIIVTNTGNVTLTNVGVTDANANAGSITPANITTLAPGATANVTAMHTITQAELDNGSVANTAIVNGSDPTGGSVTDTSDDPNNGTNNDANADGEPDDVTITSIVRNPSLSLTKTAVFNDVNNDGIPQNGETITYTFNVINTGNTTITNIVVSDPLITISGNAITLAPGANNATAFTGTYTILQANIDAGSITNSAIVNGTDPTGSSVTDTSDDPNNPMDNDINGDGEPDDSTIFTTTQMSEISVTKTGVFIDANNDGLAQVGETIQYSFAVSNLGNVTVSNITINDPIVTVSGSAISLIPGQVNSSTFTALYTLTQNDVNVGSVTNAATANGQDPTGGSVIDMSDDPTTAAQDDATVTNLGQEAKLSLLKTGVFNDVNNNGFPDVGEIITYSFEIRNTGNVSVTGISITDPNVTVNGGAINLDPNQVDTTTFTAVQTITLAHINAGSITNSATVSGMDPGNNQVTDISDDPTNATDNDANGDGDPDDATVTTLMASPMLSVTKTGIFNDTNTDGFAQVGETVSYTFTVTNTGNITLNGISITDPNVTVNGGPISLDPTVNDTATFTATYVITQADVDAGMVINTATASGVTPNGDTATDTSDDPSNPTNNDPNNDGEPDDATVTNMPANPSIGLTKATVVAADGTYDMAGEVITYNLVITNTGNVTLSNIAVTDANADVGSISPVMVATLAPGATANVTAMHTITQAELDAGSVTNTASVQGTDPSGMMITDTSDDPNNNTDNDDNGDGEPDDATITSITRSPSMSLEKTAVFNDANNDGVSSSRRNDYL